MSLLADRIAELREAASRLDRAQALVRKVREELERLGSELRSFEEGAPTYKRADRDGLEAEIARVLAEIEQKRDHPPRFFGKEKHEQDLTRLLSYEQRLQVRMAGLRREIEQRGRELPAKVQEMTARLRREESMLAEARQEHERLEAEVAAAESEPDAEDPDARE